MHPSLAALLIAGLFTPLANSQAQQRRVAIVFGNSAYRDAELPNAVPDAKMVSKALSDMDFTIARGDRDEPDNDLTYSDIQSKITLMRDYGEGTDLLLFYYAGHAAQYDGEHYLIPIDANLKQPSDIKLFGVPVNVCLTQASQAKAKRTIIVIDGCRSNLDVDNPREAGFNVAASTCVFLSTKDGKPASDGAKGSNSPFALAFVAALRNGPVAVPQLFDQIAAAVKAATANAQSPRLFIDRESWAEVCLTNASLNTPSVPSTPSVPDPPTPPRPASNRFTLAHETYLWDQPRGYPQGLVQPVATANSAFKVLAPDRDLTARGWRRVELTGWMVAQSSDGKRRLLEREDGIWEVAAQSKDRSFASNVLSLRSKPVLDDHNVLAALAQGTTVQHIRTSSLERRQWVLCTWSGWVQPETVPTPDQLVLHSPEPAFNETPQEEPPAPTLPTFTNPVELPFQAQFTFPHPKHPATVSTRTIMVQLPSGRVEMSFADHRDDRAEDKTGRVELKGTWEGTTFTSKSQKRIEPYDGWVPETIVLDFSPDFTTGTATTQFLRPSLTGKGKGSVVKASSALSPFVIQPLGLK